MSHASPAEIHDHVYGFKACPHVEGCPECRRAAEAVEAERDALKDALSGEQPEAPYELVVKLSVKKARPPAPAPKAAVSIAGLAAAALFLGALAWLLFYKPSSTTPPTPADSGNVPRKDDIDRLIRELKSSSPLRREIAEAALKAYGGTAADRLDKAKADPILIDACRGIGPEDRKTLNSLREKKVTLDMAKVPLTAAVEFLRETTNVNFVIDATSINKEENISVRGSDISVADALDQICRQLKYGWTVNDGTAVIHQHELTVPSRAPVRVLAPSDADKWASAFESPLKEKHDEAAVVLTDLGFVAEPFLWNLLDSPDTGVRERAAGLLRRLYTPNLDTLAQALELKLRTARINLDLQNASLPEVLESIGGVTGISFAIDTGAVENPEGEMISLKVADLSAMGVFKLLLSPKGWTLVVAGEVVLITKPGRALKTPRGPTWLEAETARRMEHLIDALASPDPGKQAKAADELVEMGEEALGPLLQGYRIFNPDAATRCSDVRRRIAARMGAWLTEEPFGADVRRLTTAQKDLLNRKVNLRPSGKSLDDTLRELGVPFERRAPYPWKVAFIARDLRLAWVLRAATRPHGLDFTFEGDKVVIDTAERVRQAVEK